MISTSFEALQLNNVERIRRVTESRREFQFGVVSKRTRKMHAMEAQKDLKPEPALNGPETESLRYLLDLLKIEIQSIDQIIARMDGITQTTKNWAIITWAGSIAIALGQADLRNYIVLTAVLPFLFWYVDAYWRRLQARSIFRVRKINEFLNGERLVRSFEQKRLVGFTVFDPTGRQYNNLDEEYKKYTSIWRTLRFPEVSAFYLMMIFISLGLGVFFVLVP